jgi:hypothetical protein
MPVPAALDADPIHLLIRLGRRLLHKPRGAALAPSAAPLTRAAAAVGCCCPCSVELPGEAA